MSRSCLARAFATSFRNEILATSLLATLSLFPFALPASANETFIVVLGVAQDAGYPQIECYKPHCNRAWKNAGYRRLTSSIAVVDQAIQQTFLFDATPDIREQLYRLHKIAPTKRYELNGVFLTHGHIGHYTGLMQFGHEAMGTKHVPVYAMPRMKTFLSANGPWSQLVNYENISLVEMGDGKAAVLSTNLSVTPLRVPHREEYTEAVGFRIVGPSKSALFIPDIDKWETWDTDIRDLIKSVDYALLDGSFYRDGELPNRDMSNIPHPFVNESMDLFSGLSTTDKSKVIFIHFNHTNPLLIDGSPEQLEVLQRGFRFAKEGLRLPL